MRLDAGRRLPGRNLLLEGPGVGAELVVDAAGSPSGDKVDAERDAERAAFLEALPDALAHAFGALDLPLHPVVPRAHPGGLSIAVPAPEDALYCAAEALEWAVERALGSPRGDDVLVTLQSERAAERNPRLLALMAEARARGLPALPCDDHLSIGFGKRSQTFDVRRLPDVVDWDALGTIPVAMVTGTNGKTTTTRMLARILAHEGKTVGFTSTDGLSVGGQVVEAGDWSGPGGARNVLRDQRVEAAVLETARGGLLRRGLAVTGIDAAAVTNVDDDHLGEWGIYDVPAMAHVKTLVGHAVRPGGRVVLGGDDALLRPYAGAFAAPTAFFGTDEASGVERSSTVRAGALVIKGRRVVSISDIPLAFGGAAQHNVQNALCAALVAEALGAPDHAIASGLQSLRPDDADSPGRGNLIEHDGVRLLLDFAHNPAGVRAALQFVAGLRRGNAGGRLVVLIGQAGDRSDADLDALVQSVSEGAPDHVIVRELPGYLRGRAPGEVSERFRLGFAQRGRTDVEVVRGDVAGMDAALEWSRPGDFIAYLLLVDRDGVRTRLKERGFISPA